MYQAGRLVSFSSHILTLRMVPVTMARSSDLSITLLTGAQGDRYTSFHRRLTCVPAAHRDCHPAASRDT